MINCLFGLRLYTLAFILEMKDNTYSFPFYYLLTLKSPLKRDHGKLKQSHITRCGSKGALGTRAPLGPNSFTFMQFSAKKTTRRMHYSRMHTVRNSSRLLGGCTWPGGTWSQGVYLVLEGDVPGPGGAPGPGRGVYLV